MPDKKLTDNLSNNSPILSNSLSDAEIVKAIERLKNTKDFLREKYQEQVKNCHYPELKPIEKQTYEDNKKAFNIAIKALEEFNRQKAEIERYKKYYFTHEYDKFEKEIKAEAYKKFADKLKIHAYHECDITGYRYLVVQIEEIDNLLKELVGEDK